MNKEKLGVALDGILTQTVSRRGGAPGVVAMVTDRKGNLYEGAAGRRHLKEESSMTSDTVFALFSTTKAIAGTCALQLIEEGKLNFDDPAGRYVPEIDELQVLEYFDDEGKPHTRPPKRSITIRDLFLHTSGLTYEFFSPEDQAYRRYYDIPNITACNFQSIRSVLLFDPGTAWAYGVNIDWLGLVVEKLRGKRLGEVMREKIFDPLEMQDIGFVMTQSMRDRLAVIHARSETGQIEPLPDLILPQPPEMDMGGHGLYGTVGEYMKFIRMLLDDGMGPGGRVLKSDTIAQMFEDGLLNLGLSVGGWKTADPALTNDGEFLPGIDKGWGYTFMTNREQAPTGRPAGSVMWAGLANCYYWIDRKTGIGGYWATQILPFYDVASYPEYFEFETTTYANLKN